ncbi:Hypothetical predicted protein [Paramuricea clavata]|uniref:Uncharacterized protein n=1 Tax=Paramuricea clavata TaxID=317549 RepID=A0A7D9IJ96_PARCT|nr:Hypothetical predicted protein [Paramuricea clavata]
MSAVTVSKKKAESFLWTDAEIELLLASVKVFASNCLFNGTDWEGVKSKYEKIREIFVERYPKTNDGEIEEKPNSDYPKSKSLENITKERIAAKLKTIRGNFKKAIDSGKQSGGGRVVMTYYDLCHDIWAGAPSTKSIEAQEKNDKSSEKDKSELPLYNNSDNEMEALFGISAEEEDTHGTPKSQNPTNRREKVAKYLSNEKEKRMSSKISVDKQHLHLAREDLALKRKMMETV